MSIREINCEIAPCGVFCGACPSFNKSCRGCSSDERNQKRKSKWSCKIRVCCKDKKGYPYCSYCNEVPCKIFSSKLLTRKDDPRFKYRLEALDNLFMIREAGIDKLVSSLRKKYSCPDCDGRILFYSYKCETCGNEFMPD